MAHCALLGCPFPMGFSLLERSALAQCAPMVCWVFSVPLSAAAHMQLMRELEPLNCTWGMPPPPFSSLFLFLRFVGFPGLCWALETDKYSPRTELGKTTRNDAILAFSGASRPTSKGRQYYSAAFWGSKIDVRKFGNKKRLLVIRTS